MQMLITNITVPTTEASPAAEDDYPEGDPFAADPVDEPTRRINLNDLKFGRNYSGGDD